MDASLDEAAAVEAEKPALKEQVQTQLPEHVQVDGDKEGASFDANTGSFVLTAGKEDGQQSQWAFSTWSWGESDGSMTLDPVAKATAEDRVETPTTNPMPSEELAVPSSAIQGRSSIVDFAWMVLEPVVSVATYLPPGSSIGEDNADLSSAKKVRRKSMEAPATPPRGSGDALLHVGEVELQEGYLGWWRPCCLQLWPARLRAIALQESEEVVDAPGENGQVEPSKEGDVLWEMILDPASFENSSLVYDSCFEVVGGQHRATFRCAKAADADEWVKHITLIVNWVKEQIAARKWAFVYLNVYDLAGDWRVSAFNRMSLDMLQIGGMFHAGLEVYGKEYMFGGGGDDDGTIPEIMEDIYTLSSAEESGVSSCDPRSCDRHRFRQAECLGLTTLSEKEVQDTLCVLARDWPSRCYRTLERNCIHFCRDFSEQLGVTAVPDWVNYLAVAASERHILQPVAPMDTSADSSGSTREVMCFWKHPCVLQAQSWMAGLVEMLVCESCLRELERGEAFYHCHECDFDMCVQCGEETLAQNNGNAFGLVNA